VSPLHLGIVIGILAVVIVILGIGIFIVIFSVLKKRKNRL